MYTPLLFLSEDAKESLRRYVRDEVMNHDMERVDWVADIQKYERLYWATPNPAQTSPLQGGSNIIIPVIAIAVEMMVARTIGKMFALEQFSSFTMNDEWSQIESSVEAVVDHELLKSANIKEAITLCAVDFFLLGTCVFKSGYLSIKRRATRYNQDNEEEEVEVVVRKGVDINPVQPQNFLLPFYAADVASSPWCGEDISSSEHEIKQLVANGFFYDDVYEKLENHFAILADNHLSPSDAARGEQERRENRQPLWPRRVTWKHLCVSFNTGKDYDEELYVYYHVDSDTILGIRYNDRHDLSRPYFVATHFPVPGRWAGIGQAKMGEQFQYEITTQHRQRLDAISLAILRMFKAKKGRGIKPDEPIFMGKIWMVEDMQDLEIFQTGEVYPSSFQGESNTLMFWNQRSNVNEANLGMPQVGTPGTAASDLSRVQESNTRADFSYNRFKETIRKVVLDAICIMGKYGLQHEGVYNSVSNPDEVRRFLSQSPMMLKQEIGFKFDLAGQSQNRQIDRATWTQLSGILTQTYKNALELAQQSQNPELVARLTKKALAASAEVMRQILEAFDRRNISKIAITPEDLNGSPEQNSIGQGIGAINQGTAGILSTPQVPTGNPITSIVGGS